MKSILRILCAGRHDGCAVRHAFTPLCLRSSDAGNACVIAQLRCASICAYIRDRCEANEHAWHVMTPHLLAVLPQQQKPAAQWMPLPSSFACIITRAAHTRRICWCCCPQPDACQLLQVLLLGAHLAHLVNYSVDPTPLFMSLHHPTAARCTSTSSWCC